MERIAARGLTFDVEVDGPAGGEAVLLLHGFPQSSAVWRPICAQLNAAGLRTVAPNLRGYTADARPASVEEYRITECTDDAVALLDALGIDAAHTVGHDWGAMAGWQLAGRHPERVRTLIAVSVPHPFAAAQAIAADPQQQQLSSYIGLFRQDGTAEKQLLADDARLFRSMLAESGLVGPHLEAYVAAAADQGTLTGGLNWYRAMSLIDIDGIGPITCPTTYVWGDQDQFFGRFAVDRSRDYVDGPYELVELPGMGHWIPELAPDLLAELILARVSSLKA